MARGTAARGVGVPRHLGDHRSPHGPSAHLLL